MYNNPYFNYPQIQPQIQTQQTFLPKQEIIKVNGKSSVESIQLAPNSSIIVMDTTAPLVWLCVSDGVGKVTATPYQISEYKEKPPINVDDIEARLSRIEEKLQEVDNEPNAKRVKSKSDDE